MESQPPKEPGNFRFRRLSIDVRPPGRAPPPPPRSTPRGDESPRSISASASTFDAARPRHLTMTTKQIVNHMNMIEAFAEAMALKDKQNSERPWMGGTVPGVGSEFTEYIPFPFDLEVVPDPENSKYSWIQLGFNYLHYFFAISLVFMALLFSLSLFALHLVGEVYTRELLYTVLHDGSFASLFGFIAAHCTVIVLATFFLCYPHRSSWGRFHKMRWILLGMPNIILVVSLMSQFQWIVGFGEIGHLLHEMMQAGLDVTKETPLTQHTQRMFECCGVNGYTDWDNLINSTDTIFYNGYPPSCCKSGREYITGCKVPVTLEFNLDMNGSSYIQLWTEGCYNKESVVVYVTLTLIWITVFIISITTMTATVCLWWIIRHVNIHNISLDHPFHHV